ncbi:hypothetical protein J6590_037564 [Homalodisca vitripennis]|nr:hypothetical protein J6590_037564 [Homalodisca vitripennis]
MERQRRCGTARRLSIIILLRLQLCRTDTISPESRQTTLVYVSVRNLLGYDVVPKIKRPEIPASLSPPEFTTGFTALSRDLWRHVEVWRCSKSVPIVACLLSPRQFHETNGRCRTHRGKHNLAVLTLCSNHNN